MSVVVRQAIRTALQQPVEPWFPGLARVLTEAAWRQFARRGFFAANYGTHRWLYDSPNAERWELGSFSPARTHVCRIEGLREHSRQRYERCGLVFRQLESASDIAALTSATSLIAFVPSLHVSVATYLHTVHVLQAPTADYDVSHSDPSVPFSIFVSIPRCGRVGKLRLAESIVHECMHLQLTMIEAVLPLVGHAKRVTFSPWRQTLRPVGGVLQGMYVFAVIDAYYRVLSKYPSLTADEEAFIVKRRKEIGREMRQVSQAQAAVGLTEAGCVLARQTLEPFLTRDWGQIIGGHGTE